MSIRHCVTCKLTYNNLYSNFQIFVTVVTGVGFRQISFTPIFVHELRVIRVPIDCHWKCVRVHCACAESHDSCVGDQKQLHFWNPRPRFAYSLCNFGGSTMNVIKVICENNARPVLTRSSAIAEGPRDASCQLKSCQLPRNSAETTYTTSPD